jgi:aspartyl-tRNA(Asn)/glutamyl-tRNA(Gln) amidotransferase subunit A
VIGPLTNSVADAATVLDVMAGRDDSDATSIEREESYRPNEYDFKGKKIGLIKQYFGEGLDPAIKSGITAVISQLEAAGAEVHEVDLPAAELALACYYILVPAEVSSNLARYDGIKFGHRTSRATDLESTYRLSREEGFGAEAKRRIMIGTYVLSSGYYDAYYKRAQKVRTELVNEFEAAFAKYDLLLGPTAPTVAFPMGAKAQDPLAMYLNDVMTVAVNLVGSAAISLPAGMSDGLPYGIQVISQQRSEGVLLSAAAAVEAVVGDWRSR